MLDRLALEGRDRQPASTPIPRKLAVMDLDTVSKAWTYVLPHTMDTIRSGSKLITMRALALYYLLNRHAVNICLIIYTNTNEMIQSTTKKSLGHATIILLLCRKEGVLEFTDGRITNLERPLDAGWITENPRKTTPVTEAPETEERPEESTGPRRPQP